MCRPVFKWLHLHLSPAKLCPKTNVLLRIFSLSLFLLLFWGVAYSILGEEIAPSSNLFILASLFVLSYIAGTIFSMLKLPPMVGMMLVGLTMRNLKIFDMEGSWKVAERIIRSSTLVVILLKAGLALDGGTLEKLGCLVISFGLLPCIADAAAITLVAHYTLGFSLNWAAMLGFVIAAMAPGIVIPYVLTLEEQGYGREAGIATLVIVSSSIDNIFTISAFGVARDFTFHERNLVKDILQTVQEFGLGLFFGIAWGLISIYIPHRDEKWVVAGRCVMIGLGGLFATHGSSKIDKSGAGPIACVSMAFVACWGWKKQGYPVHNNPVEKIFSYIWRVCVYVLFSLIGTSIDFSTLEGHTVIYGCATIIAGSVVRFGVTFLSLYGQLTSKEILFLSICWFPKATVQAVIGPMALDEAEKASPLNREDVERAKVVLTLSVLLILMTAPLGAIIMFISGPILLLKQKIEPEAQVEAQNETETETETSTSETETETETETSTSETETETSTSETETETEHQEEDDRSKSDRH